MKRNSLFSVLIFFVASVMGTGQTTFAQDWPQWRGAGRNGVLTGFIPPAKWEGSLEQKWKITVGSGDATPALVGERLYVFSREGTEEVISCVSVNDGKVIWSSKYQAPAVTGAASSHPGPRSSPAVASGKVVTFGVGGVLICWDADTGKELWRKEEFPKVVPQFFTAVSPLIDEGLCIIHFGGKGNGAVIAYDLNTGQQKWRWDGDGPSYSSPITATIGGVKQVIVLTERNLVGLAFADGKLLWQTLATPSGRSCNAPTPIVNGNTVIFTGQGRGMFAVKVEKDADTFKASELWSNPEVGCEFNTPVLKSGYLYGFSARGNLFCLDATTGKTMWVDQTKFDRFGSVLDAGSVLLALPPNGELLVFKPNEKQFELVEKVKLAESQTYAHPVISGKRIFVKDRDSVIFYALK